VKNYLIPAVVLAAGVSAQAQYSAWLPKQNEFIVTPVFTYSTFDEFWLGDDKMGNPGAVPSKNDESLDQYTGYLVLEYGFTERLAADLSVGYTATDTEAFVPGGDSDRGLADVMAGLRYRLVDEHSEAAYGFPTVTIRAGVIIPGTYDENFPFSAGDGAHGFETSILLAKEICPGFGAFGDIGYRVRENDVPDDFLASVGLYAAYRGFSASVAYRHVQGLSGPDIGDPGFTFPEVKEIVQNVEGGLGYTDSGGRFYQVFYARTIDGENTGQKDIIGFSASFPFGGK
jgi:hypothetical protein